jgi:hypothetical protein
LNDAAGRTIAKPTADDCAGASEIGKLVVVKSWQSNGEFDAKYTLPKSGQQFGKNARFCDKTHHCALVVADANPSAPAYYIETKIQFVDESPTTPTSRPKTTTTKPTTPATKPSAPASQPSPGANPAGVTANGHAPTATGPSSGSASFGVSVSATIPAPGAGAAPSLPTPTPTLPAPGANPVPAPVASALDQVCTQLANAVRQAGGDPDALLAACAAIESGNGAQQLATVLASPSLLCIEGASAWQNNAQITDACNAAAAGIAPLTSQVGGLLGPVLSGP